MSGPKVTEADHTRLQSEWPLLDDDKRWYLTGVHVVLVVIRHLYTLLDKDDMEKIPNIADEPPVVQAALILFNYNGTAADRKKAVHLKSKAVSSLWIHHDTTTLQMFTSGLLNETLWAREPFHLFRQNDWVRPADQSSNWQLSDETRPKSIALKSLVLYDGTITLSDCVSSKFGVFTDEEDTNEKTRWQWFHHPGLRTFIRVHYKPQKRLPFDQVKSFTINCETQKSNAKNPRTLRLKNVKQKYYIVAAVRLGKAGGQDIVRTWDQSGTCIGDDDHEWLLFYHRTGQERRLKDYQLEEVNEVIAASLRRSGNSVRVAKPTSQNPAARKALPSASAPKRRAKTAEISRLMEEMSKHSVVIFSNDGLRIIPTASWPSTHLPVNNLDSFNPGSHISRDSAPILPGSISGLFPVGLLKCQSKPPGPAATARPVSQPSVPSPAANSQLAAPQKPYQQAATRQQIGEPSLPTASLPEPLQGDGPSAQPVHNNAHRQTPTGNGIGTGTIGTVSSSHHDATQTGQWSSLNYVAPIQGIPHRIPIPGLQFTTFISEPMPPSDPMIPFTDHRRTLCQAPTQMAYERLLFRKWLAWSQENTQKAFEQLQGLTQRHLEQFDRQWRIAQRRKVQQMQQMQGQMERMHQQLLQLQHMHQPVGTQGPVAQPPQNQSHGSTQTDPEENAGQVDKPRSSKRPRTE
ncbi:hypothetical protein PG993_007919 [Apiospora rasikravindrae]|uniref:Uncharacterized protein n=1 Tax=Apiospora rasikravindrae TaxID=990691 RepID=A0ABR1SYV0_9PEZI